MELLSSIANVIVAGAIHLRATHLGEGANSKPTIITARESQAPQWGGRFAERRLRNRLHRKREHLIPLFLE